MNSIPKKLKLFWVLRLLSVLLLFLLFRCRKGTPGRAPLPPPGRIYPVVNSHTPYQDSSSFEQSIGYASAPAPPDNFSYNKVGFYLHLQLFTHVFDYY